MHTTRHRAAILAAAAALLVLAGCSSSPGVDTDVQGSTPTPTPEQTEEITGAASESPSPTPTEEPESEPEITLSEVGFLNGGEFGIPTAYALAENPSEHVVALQLEFSAYNADDAVLATEIGFTPIIRSGQTVPAVTDLFVPEGTRIDRVEAVIVSMDSEPDESPTSQMHGANLSFFDDGYTATLTGMIESDYINSYDQVEVVALCRDGDEVTGAGYGWVERFVTPDTPAPFEVMLTGTGSAETCEVLAAPGLSSTERTPDES